MKIIPLSKAKAHLSKYAKLCQKEPVVVTVNGHPAFQLVPLNEGDDLVNELLEHNPAFGAMVGKRLKEPTLSAKQALRRLG